MGRQEGEGVNILVEWAGWKGKVLIAWWNGQGLEGEGVNVLVE